MNGFKVKALEIKNKDSVCLSWKLARGQIKFRSNQGRYAGKRVSLMSPSLFNCFIIYWAEGPGGDSQSQDDKDSDRLSPVEPHQGQAPATSGAWACHPCHLDGAKRGGTDPETVPSVVQPPCLGTIFLCHFIFLTELRGMGTVNFGVLLPLTLTPPLQPGPGALPPPCPPQVPPCSNGSQHARHGVEVRSGQSAG